MSPNDPQAEELLRRLVRLINASEKRPPGCLAMDDSDPNGHGEWFQNNHACGLTFNLNLTKGEMSAETLPIAMIGNSTRPARSSAMRLLQLRLRANLAPSPVV